MNRKKKEKRKKRKKKGINFQNTVNKHAEIQVQDKRFF